MLIRQGDPGDFLLLLAESFRELISQHPELGSVLTNLIADRLGAGSHDALGGKVLSGYRLGECVGRGGMAIV